MRNTGKGGGWSGCVSWWRNKCRMCNNGVAWSEPGLKDGSELQIPKWRRLSCKRLDRLERYRTGTCGLTGIIYFWVLKDFTEV